MPVRKTHLEDQTSPSFSIIIPARQEALRLPKTLRLLQNFIDQHSYSAEIIPVIQGDDATSTIVAEIAAADSRIRPIFDTLGVGKGRAVGLGMKAAQGTILLFIDADLSVPLSCMHRLMKTMENTPHIDLLIGSRYLPESRILIPQPFLRRFSGRVFNILLRVLGLTRLHDTQCGCKLFRHEAAKKIFANTTIEGFAFDVQALLLAQHWGYHTQEAAVEWIDTGNSRFDLLRDGFKALQDIFHLAQSSYRHL